MLKVKEKNYDQDKRKSAIWQYYESSSDNTTVTCNICSKKIQRVSDLSTSPMINHLENKDNDEYLIFLRKNKKKLRNP